MYMQTVAILHLELLRMYSKPADGTGNHFGPSQHTLTAEQQNLMVVNRWAFLDFWLVVKVSIGAKNARGE